MQKLKKPALVVKEYFLKYIFFFICLFIYILIKTLPFSFIPDYLKMQGLEPTNYFYLLTEITASIFGILFTVVLLTFQMLKNISLRRRSENILHNQWVSNFISLTIAIIIGSVYSYATIPSLNNSNNLTIAYFLLILFTCFIILIFPVSIFILNEVNSLKKAEKDIRRLKYDDFKQVLSLRYDKFQQKDSGTVLFKIGTELNSAIRDNDHAAVSAILQSLNKKVIELIGNGTNRSEVSQLCDGLSLIWKSGHSDALRAHNFQYYLTVWECIDELFEFACERKIQLLHIQDIYMYIYEFIGFLAKHKLSECLEAGANTLYNALQINLKYNCPPEEEVSDLHSLSKERKRVIINMNSDMQWDYINNILRDIRRIQDVSIEIGDKELFTSTQRILKRFIAEIEHGDFSNLGEHQEWDIVLMTFLDILFNARKANEQNLFPDTLRTYTIEGYLIARFIIKRKMFIVRILDEISDFMITKQREKRLNYWDTMNSWGAIPRHTAKEYLKNKDVRRSTKFIFSSFKQMKEEIEKNQLPDQIKNYLEIESQMKALKRTLQEVGGNEIKFIRTIDKSLKSFKKIDSTPDFRIVKWKNKKS